MVKKITEKQFHEALEAKMAVVDFSAKWCGPCKMLEPVLEEVSEELSDEVAFYNVDDLRIWTGVERYKFYDSVGGGRIVLSKGLPCIRFGNELVKLSEYGG